ELPPAIPEAWPASAPSLPRSEPTWRLVLSVLLRGVRAVGSLLDWLFGAVVLLIGLAVLAALPLLQFLSLGYLLEAGGRVGRTGRLRDGFIGVRKAARVGGIVLGTWLMLLPLQLVSALATDAQLIDPDGPVALAWRRG